MDGILQGVGEGVEWNKLSSLFSMWLRTGYEIPEFFKLFREFSDIFAKEMMDKEL